MRSRRYFFDFVTKKLDFCSCWFYNMRDNCIENRGADGRSAEMQMCEPFT